MLLDLGMVGCTRSQKAADAAEHGEHHEETDGEEGRELDQQLGRDRHDQAFLVLGGVDVAGAEQHGERGHRRAMTNAVSMRQTAAVCRGRAPSSVSTEMRDGFELQRDVGQRARHRDDGDDRGDGLALAVAGGEEVGDRGDVLALGQPNDAQQQRASRTRRAGSGRDRPE